MQLSRDNLASLTSDQEPAKTDEPATTEAASVLEPAAESPVETAEDEIADKAEEPNTDENKVKESALDPTKRRLELWNQSKSGKLMIHLLPTNQSVLTHCRAHRSRCPRKVLQGVACRNLTVHLHSLKQCTCFSCWCRSSRCGRSHQTSKEAEVGCWYCPMRLLCTP